MAKNILIPIDFNIESLNTLKFALEDFKSEKVNVILICAQNLSTSITELLFHSPYKIIQNLNNSKFSDALNILKNSYETTLNSVQIELFHGSNLSAFNTYASTRKIDIIYIPQHYLLQLKNNGFNPIPLIKKSSVNYKEITWSKLNNSISNNELNQLFN